MSLTKELSSGPEPLELRVLVSIHGDMPQHGKLTPAIVGRPCRQQAQVDSKHLGTSAKNSGEGKPAVLSYCNLKQEIRVQAAGLVWRQRGVGFICYRETATALT